MCNLTQCGAPKNTVSCLRWFLVTCKNSFSWKVFSLYVAESIYRCNASTKTAHML